MTDSGLGPLGELVGTWIGEGLEVTTASAGDDPEDWSPHAVATSEAMAFAQFGHVAHSDEVRRGPDSSIGVYYVHHATESRAATPRFVEPGIWMVRRGSGQARLVRLATVRGAGSIVAGGDWESAAGPPQIPSLSPQPIDLASGRRVAREPVSAPEQREDTAGVSRDVLEDPAAQLRARLEGQRVTTTTTLNVVGRPGPDPRLGDRPFGIVNPAGISLQATFWIEAVVNGDRGPRLQLQYHQTTFRDVDGIGWPTLSVATLVKR